MPTLTSMIHFVLVTQSTGKLAEVERILGERLEHASIELPEIQAINVEEVVISKVRYAYQMLCKPIIVEDTGLFVEAWNGLPGALIKWFVQGVGESGICRMMKDYPNRKAWAQTVVATFDGNNEPITFSGKVDGEIALTPAGEGGFGWDRIFIPTGASKTFGQMTAEEKDRYSMRRVALESMLAHFKDK